MGLVQSCILLQVLRNGVGETLGLDPLLAEESRLIPVRTITQDCNNVLARAQLLGQLNGRHHIQSRRCSDINTFLVQQAVDHADRVLIWDMECTIYQLNVRLQVIRHTSLTDTLCDRASTALIKFTAARDITVQNTAWRICQVDLRLALRFFLQEPSDSSQGTSSTCRASEAIYLTIQLLPDLRSCCFNMGLAIRSVVELVGPDRVLDRLCVTSCLMVIVLRVVECHSRDRVHLGACRVMEMEPV